MRIRPRILRKIIEEKEDYDDMGVVVTKRGCDFRGVIVFHGVIF